jgi:hypothetical protein
VVFPTVKGCPGGDYRLLDACLELARRAEQALRLFECWLAGEARAVRLRAATVHELLEQCLGDYRTAERTLLAGLEDLLPGQERDRLARDYWALFAVAPTRPHPRGPHAGRIGRFAFRLRAGWDRALDTMDSRPGLGRLPL